MAAPERVDGCGNKRGDSMQTALSSWHCHLERSQDIGQEGREKLPYAIPQEQMTPDIEIVANSGASLDITLRSRHFCNEADKRPAHNNDGDPQEVSSSAETGVC